MSTDACDSSPCLHAGTCQSGVGDSGEAIFRCYCPSGFTGDNCEDSIAPAAAPTGGAPTATAPTPGGTHGVARANAKSAGSPGDAYRGGPKPHGMAFALTLLAVSVASTVFYFATMHETEPGTASATGNSQGSSIFDDDNL